MKSSRWSWARKTLRISAQLGAEENEQLSRVSYRDVDKECAIVPSPERGSKSGVITMALPVVCLEKSAAANPVASIQHDHDRNGNLSGL